MMGVRTLIGHSDRLYLGIERTEYASKLPRPTRSLSPCGDRSLLEDGAFCCNDIGAPVPMRGRGPASYYRPCLRRGAMFVASTSTGGLDCPADVIPGVLTLCPKRGCRGQWCAFAVVVPECRIRRSRSSHHRSQFTGGSSCPERVPGRSSSIWGTRVPNSCGLDYSCRLPLCRSDSRRNLTTEAPPRILLLTRC